MAVYCATCGLVEQMIKRVGLKIRRSTLTPGRFTLGKLFTPICFRHKTAQFDAGHMAMMPYGWEGDRGSGVILVICVTDFIGLSTYGLKA